VYAAPGREVHGDVMPRARLLVQTHFQQFYMCVTDAHSLPIYCSEREAPSHGTICATLAESSDMTTPDDLFFTQTGMSRERVQRLIETSLHGADDGELFPSTTDG
jgi:hypothetical protein